MKIPIIKKLIGIALCLVVVISSFLSAIPAYAGNTNIYISPATQSVANGSQVVVDVMISTTTPIRAFDITVNFNAAKLQVATPFASNVFVSEAGGYLLQDWAIARAGDGGGYLKTNGPTVNNTTGSVRVGYMLTGVPGSGATGTGKLFSVRFNTIANDTIANIGAPSNDKIVDINAAYVPNVGTTGGAVTIGTPVYPDLTVSSVTANGTGLDYTITYTVTNNGLAAAPASTTSIVIDGGAPISLACPALAAGASDTVTTSVITVSNYADVIVVTADSANVVEESNESNNSNSTGYQVYPDLVISAASTSGTTPNYTITYTVTNNGLAPAGASNTHIVIDGGAPIIITCPALAVGESSTTTTSPQTISGTQDTIVITADAGLAVVESNELNNSGNTTYNYAAPNQGTVPVDGIIDDVFSFTVPTAVNMWNHPNYQPNPSASLKPGLNTADKFMVVESNHAWTVIVQGENNGQMAKWNTTTRTYASPMVKLNNRLRLIAANEQTVDLTGGLQLLADGQTSDLDGSTGYSRTIPVQFSQVVLFSDPALSAGFAYHMDVTFTCNTTAY